MLWSVWVCAIAAAFTCAPLMPTIETLTKETCSPSEAQFCQGEITVTYPELDIRGCTIIPLPLREKISKKWGPPKVAFPTAEKIKYVLMMVDPDAPSRSYPTRSHWRHWLVADIKGHGLRTGNMKGSVLSAYTPPTPPQHTGMHRYQLLLFKQPKGQTISLNKTETASLGNWEPQAFSKRFGLGYPVASTQFLTQNYQD